MALKDILAYFTPEATSKYNETQVDKAALRKPLLRGIKTAREQFNADQFKKPNRWFSVKNEHVAFHPKLGGRTLTLNGVQENHMPSERFVEFLDLMEKEVDAGEFDEVIADHGKGNVDVHISKARSAKSGGRGTGLGTKAQPDDPEWMARFRAKVGDPDPSIVDPVPNTKGTKWVAKANSTRGIKGKS